MIKNNYPSMFIVFEGIDGSGKSTQTKLLTNYLRNKGYRVANYDFPRYDTKYTGFIDEYLKGKYGTSEEVGPYRASIFYACDRYDASFDIKKRLKEGKVVVSDRYFASNVGHQGGKIKNKEERKKFIKWLYELEYGIFKIPKPDITFILKTSAKIARQLAPKITDKEKKKKRKAYLGNRTRDIHEKDISHLTNSLNSYLEVAKEFPKQFYVIECLENNKLLPPEIIHKKILSKLKI